MESLCFMNGITFYNEKPKNILFVLRLEWPNNKQTCYFKELSHTCCSCPHPLTWTYVSGLDFPPSLIHTDVMSVCWGTIMFIECDCTDVSDVIVLTCVCGEDGGRTEKELEKDFKFLSVREEYEKKNQVTVWQCVPIFPRWLEMQF